MIVVLSNVNCYLLDNFNILQINLNQQQCVNNKLNVWFLIAFVSCYLCDDSLDIQQTSITISLKHSCIDMCVCVLCQLNCVCNFIIRFFYFSVNLNIKKKSLFIYMYYWYIFLMFNGAIAISQSTQWLPHKTGITAIIIIYLEIEICQIN